MVFTPDIFMLSKALDYAIKRILAVCTIAIQRKLLVKCLICHIRESVLVPKGTVACLPYLPTNIAKLSAAAKID